MVKTQIDLDDEALERARAALGTQSKVDTVNTALRLAAEVGPRPRRRYVPARELKAALADLPDVDIEDLRADADRSGDDSFETEETHLEELFNNAADSVWHTR
ncbi:hypothetical protein DFQ14_10293 [Halopolyspora algeriensis]|uniref:VapB protein of antitoxin of type II toxin-antitoxin system n=1 Tax=Halopolyspora algeriensis TaxID=1500506 RepID=A0A368VY79_9ACTN|nr:type II toxin-antitoxin system VapB family antitoxin [Halopolyspora algeriensis]RCW45792.1 hypothetical protein DFQ14_10293 [Halopolyspora algeriensis]TQM54176.1 hypothetical protein FHU43_2355 [Halopolyspora algeriensis]